MLDKKQNPYENCPNYETKSFIMRLVQESDAQNLLECYSDSISAKIFNSDNCNDNFIYKSLDEMKSCIEFWIKSYEYQCFIRFSVIDKKINKAIGTIEFFAKKETFGDFGKVGVLRVDLVSSYEIETLITEVLNVINDNFYEVFEVQSIITKAIPEAEQRIIALRNSGYTELKAPLICFDSYYVRVE